MNPVTKMTTTFAIAALASLTALAGSAQAQVLAPPAPLLPTAPIPPVPQVAPLPAPAPIPRLLTPSVTVNGDAVLVDLAALDRMHVLNAPEIAAAAQAAVSTTLNQQSYVYDYNRQMYGNSDYSAGKDLMLRRQYEQAIVRFDKVIAKKEAKADGAFYYKAYSQYKLGKSEDALATIAALRKEHPQSPYLQDAKVLESDARRGGKTINPADVDDDDLKLLALQGLLRTNPDVAVSGAKTLLTTTNSLKVKRQALYVLAQATQPDAYQTLLSYAKGGGNPDLQLEAISYLAANRNKQTTPNDLMNIYQQTQDTEVKLAIISALRSSGNQTALTQIVTSGNTPIPIRTSALNGLTGILSPTDLWTLYEKETNKDLKMQMVGAFGSMGALDQLGRIVKSEKDPEIRRRALRSLGNMKTEKTGQILVDLYAGEQDVDAKKSIIASLGNQGNVDGLISIARKESNLTFTTEIVRKLSEMAPRNKAAADYLMEIIKK